MSRKSRKKRKKSEESKEQKIYKAAMYVRLSHKGEEESLETQKTIIREYLKNYPEIVLIKEFEDYGWSGGNFHRPGFYSMIEEIRNGKIDCIVVKDLSRFGRNYIETGRFLEYLFPKMGVRFLSVQDNYDTLYKEEEREAFLVPLKNIVHDFYKRDIGDKIRSAIRIKQERGEYVGSCPPYGYQLDKERKLQIDYEAGLVVKEIFQKYLDGVSIGDIRRKLNEEGVLSPCRYFARKGILKKDRTNGKGVWDDKIIGRMLMNPVYCGHRPIRKTRTLPWSGKKENIDKEQWDMLWNCHPPLIEEEVYKKIEKRREGKTVGKGL
ncbi:hypothetical protein D7X25_33635 [bacterium 1XD42-8]|jgi:site-specific DNA recombinase|nr:recombinase family protein [Lachnospiraceae bacterium]RKJ34294.1 hypothetical protein D7X25_33635 [bacterium 1XD42-8]